MTSRSKDALPLPGARKVTGTARRLWEHLTGREKHSFPLGAKGCDLGSGAWLLFADGGYWGTVAIERGDELYETGTVAASMPEVVALADRMKVFPSDAELAAAERERKYGHLDKDGWVRAVVDTLNSQGAPDRARVAGAPGEGVLASAPRRSAAPKLPIV